MGEYALYRSTFLLKCTVRRFQLLSRLAAVALSQLWAYSSQLSLIQQNVGGIMSGCPHGEKFPLFSAIL